MNCRYHETRWIFAKRDGTQVCETISVEMAEVLGNDPEWEFISKECHGPRRIVDSDSTD